jgi:amino acid transporter
MHTPTGPPGTAAQSKVLSAVAAGALPSRSITARTVGAATPMTVVAGVVPTGIAATGGNAFPVVFIAIAAVLAVFFVGYLAAARRFPPVDASGAFYTLIRHGLGRHTGVGAAWVAVAAYTALTLGLFGLIGSTVTPLLSAVFAVSVPWQVVAVAAVAIVGALGLVGINVGTRLLIILVTLEIAMILIVSVANWANPAPGGDSLASLDPRLLLAPLAVTAARLALGILGYVGNELTVNHTHDARSGHHGVAQATYATLTVLTVVYVLGASGMSVTLGPDQAVAAAHTNPGGMFVGTALTSLGTVAADIVRVLFATSVLAGAISFHGATSRYCYFLGRDRTAPRVLGRPSRRHGTPFVASLTQTALALAAIIIVSALDADPVLVLFYIGGTAGAAGILILLTLTAVATAVTFLRPHPEHPTRRGAITTAAVTSSTLLTVLTATVLIELDTLLGVSPDSALPTIVRLTYVTFFGLGVLWAAVMRLRTPELYRTIAATAAPAAPTEESGL